MENKVSKPIDFKRLGRRFAKNYIHHNASAPRGYVPDDTNPLQEYFFSKNAGRVLWKWHHYLEIYHRHLNKFRATTPSLIEVGVADGGGLEMWRDYFGPQATISGVDIDPGCRKYADKFTQVFIGDQADRTFWQSVRKAIPRLNVVIDDGGHSAVQQMITLEELLPHIQPGGVYICEDIHGAEHGFNDYLHGIVDVINSWQPKTWKRSVSGPTIRRRAFQQDILSVHHYPFLVVLEKAPYAPTLLVSEKRGNVAALD